MRTDQTTADFSPPQVRLDPAYLSNGFATAFYQAFSSPTTNTQPQTVTTKDKQKQQAAITMYPFHTAQLRHIFDPHFLHSLKDELRELSWHERLNDLYWFHQTDDLALNQQPHIRALRQYLSGDEFVGFMERITGLQLARGHLDIAAQRYKQGNHLLCHDDDVQRGKLTRKIAYIIYLVDEGWGKADGGCLGLFECDKDRNPTKVVARILPEFNSMGFFLTGHNSYHTVEEVTAGAGKERWSVTGWFYGPAADDEEEEEEPTSTLLSQAIPALQPVDNADSALEDWINTDYLDAKAQNRIQETFLEQSSVELRQFIQPSIYAQIQAELDTNQSLWRPKSAPAHLCHYLELDPHPLSTLHALCRFLRSSVFAHFLHSLASLDFTEITQQVRRFDPGHYTLIHDQALDPDGLDVCLSLNPPTLGVWDDQAWGGATHYIADTDELLRIVPKPNSLSLVLRDEGTLRFVKYLNQRAPDSGCRDIAMVFVEPS